MLRAIAKECMCVKFHLDRFCLPFANQAKEEEKLSGWDSSDKGTYCALLIGYDTLFVWDLFLHEIDMMSYPIFFLTDHVSRHYLGIFFPTYSLSSGLLLHLHL